ncbi:hypothetical protein D3C71_1592510 [compost metagenome]
MSRAPSTVLPRTRYSLMVTRAAGAAAAAIGAATASASAGAVCALASEIAQSRPSGRDARASAGEIEDISGFSMRKGRQMRRK